MRDPVWRRVLEINERIYRVLTLEFICTLPTKFVKGAALEDNPLISFSLGGVERKMTMREFTFSLNIYPPEFITDCNSYISLKIEAELHFPHEFY
ncbi:unnamed protein product [Linum trigynum]|uniref:Uncharacterized protein n=1 Tax=Linum trigynum TaxID=586398 RepID=A0AAV2DZR9_9ROSI